MKTCYNCGLEYIHLPKHIGFENCREEIYFQGKQDGHAEPIGKRMMVRIKKGATSLCRTLGTNDIKYLRAILFLEGRWLEIETDFLFVNQFNTVQTEHAENGLRLRELLTDMIVNDARKYETKEEKRLYL